MKESEIVQRVRKFCKLRAKNLGRKECCSSNEMASEILLFPYAGQVDATPEEKKFYEFISKFPKAREYTQNWIEDWENSLDKKKRRKPYEPELLDNIISEDLSDTRFELTGDTELIDAASYFLTAFRKELSLEDFSRLFWGPYQGIIEEGIIYSDIFQ